MDRYSTVLQRPPHFDEDGSSNSSNAGNARVGASEDRGPRGGLRDILNPVSSSTPATAPPPRPPFSLRSPTQPPHDYRHHQSAPPSRSILNSPYAASPSVSLPPPLQAPPSLASSATPTPPTTTTSSTGLQQHPQTSRSPLHAPTVYFPAELRDREAIREKSVVSNSSFYDPTTDSSSRDKTRRGSDTGAASPWRTGAQTSPPKPQVSTGKSHLF